MPQSITVTSGTLVSYDSTTGIAVLSGSNPIVSIVCAVASYSITATLTGATASQSNPSTINQGSIATLSYTANQGYVLPSTITINGVTGTSGSTGVSWSYNSAYGTITLSNPTDNISITITCIEQLVAPTIELAE